MSPITLDYSGRAALVTGAATGIGQASALALAAAGFGVVVADLNESGLQDTVEQIEAAGGSAKAIGVDIGDAEKVERMVDFALESYGRLDAAVNNAGIGPRYQLTGPDNSLIDNMPIEDWDEQVRVNLNGTFYCTRFEVRAMKRNESGGSIVNLSSTSATLALEGMAGYCASKKGVLAVTETAAVEFGRHNIRVNAVLPGSVRTNMSAATIRAADPEAQKRLVATTPMNRRADASELGATILWLCSDESSYVNGQAITVDGGTTIRHARSGWS